MMRNTRYSAIAVALGAVAVFIAASVAEAQQPRALGLDVSAWQGNMSANTWNNIGNVNVENRRFVFIRSSRGGTTGYYDMHDAANNNGLNTLSQRYDDPYFIQNINRATAAGMYAGSYHFSRPDVIASTLNANGIANSGADEADHFIQMAGPWMRPGYLLPVHDLEAGQAQRTSSELSTFAIDFSNRINEVMGFRPIVYSSQSYANYINSSVPAVYPHLWIARWPQGSGNQFAGDLQNDNPPPSPSTANVYGKWNPNHTVANPYPDGHPWKFWQYSSGERLQSFNNGNSNLDGDVANGGIEFLKDHLVPALWMNDSNGDWSTIANWNSGQTPVAPVTGPGQVAPVGPQTLPTPRLPGAAGSGVTSGQNDTVLLDRPNADITVTLSAGSHNIRKLYAREALDITGGTLNINYDNPKLAPNDPLRDPASTLISAQFSAPVSLSGSGNLSVYRLQVDPLQTFTLGGGSLTFGQIDLMRDNATPAKIAVTGTVTFNPRENGTATISNGGSGNSGLVDLGGGARIFNVADGGSGVDMAINVPISNGSLTKAGLGTLAVGSGSNYLGDTTVQAGVLSVTSAFLPDSADVYVADGATLNLGFGGTDAVRALHLNGLPQAEGVWGSPGSGAQFTSPYLSGSGFLHVTATPPPPPPPGPGNVIDDFEIDEGHFNSVYNLSPPSQTFGLATGTTIDRVETEQQGLGVGSQRINLVSSVEVPLDPTWQIRHNSGIGAVAQPAGNVPLVPTGSVGFWLKTDDAGAGAVQIGIDDPVCGNNGIERGTPIPIIADNQWHLYQWSLEDDDDWDLFNPGTNGAIDAVNGTVTIDSIWFTGSGDAQIYLDNVSHNPNGLLAALIPGDYDRDGDVDTTDYNLWRGQAGQAVQRGSGGDFNNDGQVDMADYIVWRKNLSEDGGGSGNSANPTATPEPTGLVLAALAAVTGLAARRRRSASR